MSYNDRVEKIEDGEAVEAVVANRASSQLEQNVQYLKDRIDASNTGAAVFAHEARIEDGMLVGTPVYFDSSSSTFKPALAAIGADPISGVLRPADSSQVWGILAFKQSDVTGNILLTGYAELDISDVVVGDTGPGLYYLSGAQAGRLSNVRLGAGIPVLRATNNGVFVLPHWQDPTLLHLHLKFNMRCSPSDIGYEPNALNDPQDIDNPNPDILGWLPADHEIFDSRAPEGAKFGYNLSQDPSLNASWPPTPIDQAYVEWIPGGDQRDGYRGLSDSLIQLNRYGIWWMSNEYEDVPWNIDCPFEPDEEWDGVGYRPVPYEMRIWFSRPTYLTDVTAVTSLVSNDSRLKITCEGTDKTAAVGGLEISLDLVLSQNDGVADGSNVIKNYNAETGEFNTGPVVEGIVAAGSGIAISSTNAAIVDGIVVNQGIVSVALQDDTVVELGVSQVKLSGVGDESLQDVQYLGFPEATQSSFRGTVSVPTDLSVENPHIQLRFWVLGRIAGELPELSLSGRILPAALTSPTSLVLADTDNSLSSSDTHDEADQYSLIVSEPLAISPGDLYVFTLERGDADGYLGEVGIIRQTAAIISGA